MWKCDLHITLYEEVVMYRLFQKYPCYFWSLKSHWELHGAAAESMAWGTYVICRALKDQPVVGLLIRGQPGNSLLFLEKRWTIPGAPRARRKPSDICIFRKPSDICHLKAGDSHKQDTSWHSSRTLYKNHHNDLNSDMYVLVAPELCDKGQQCNPIQMGT